MTSYAVSADTTGEHHDCSSGAGEQAAIEDFMVQAVSAIKQQQRRMPWSHGYSSSVGDPTAAVEDAMVGSGDQATSTYGDQEENGDHNGERKKRAIFSNKTRFHSACHVYRSMLHIYT
jgi:hypothetical protein